MRLMNPKKITIVILEFIITEIISFIIQSQISTETIKNLKMKTIIDNAIIIGTILISLFILFQLTYWYIANLNRKIKKQSVINKYNTIMIVRFEENYKAHICSVFNQDKQLFTKEELKYLNNYLTEKENLRVEMKGKNNVFGSVL